VRICLGISTCGGTVGVGHRYSDGTVDYEGIGEEEGGLGGRLTVELDDGGVVVLVQI